MKHDSLIRLVPGADTAVLFIHGIAGTPRHFDELLPLTQLVPDGWSVYNLLLPGHGGTVGDFSCSSMDLWWEKAQDAFRSLSETHSRMILVGHSMGTLFSIRMALENPEKIAGMFLLAVPLRPKMSPSGVVRMLRLAFGCLREDNAGDMALCRACGVEPTWKLWQYLGWIPRFLELFREIYATEGLLKKLSVPTVALQSDRDELVFRQSCAILKKNPVIQVDRLPNSGHFYYAPEDEVKVKKAFCAMMQALKKHD